MIIHRKDREDIDSHINNVYGYICDSITLNGDDFRNIVALYKANPEEFNAWLHQMEGRFLSNRLRVTT